MACCSNFIFPNTTTTTHTVCVCLPPPPCVTLPMLFTFLFTTERERKSFVYFGLKKGWAELVRRGWGSSIWILEFLIDVVIMGLNSKEQREREKKHERGGEKKNT